MKKTISIEMTLQEAITLWSYLDVRPIGEHAETLRWIRDRVAKRFSEAVDTNIETEAKAAHGS